VIDFGSEFQTVGAECRKARFANSVLVKGLIICAEASVKLQQLVCRPIEAFLLPLEWHCYAKNDRLHNILPEMYIELIAYS